MEIQIEKTKETRKIEFFGKVEDLLDNLKINPEEVIVARNGTLVTKDEVLSNSDKIKILSVVSGG